MTFLIQRSVNGDVLTLMLSGDIASDRAAELEAILNADAGRQVVFDLRDVAVVDRAGVRLLARSEVHGATLTNCPPYVREWIERERDAQDADPSRAREPMMQETATAAEENTFKSTAGLNIFFRSWRPAGTARAVIVIVPGFNSHSGYYGWVAAQLVARDLAVYAVDLRGRGKSDGERFYVATFADYLSDVDGMVRLAKSREPALPVFVLGHSAGGVLACLYAVEHQRNLAGLICESFAFQTPAPDVALAVLKGLGHIFPHAHVLDLKNEDFSRDPNVVAAMNADPLIAHETQPTQTVAELVRADERLKGGFSRITLPLLILHGTSDKAAKASGSQVFFDAAGSKDKTLKLYDGHFHDLLNDVDKETVVEDIKSWLGARVPAA
ncbi:MAG TPA: alpha/beta fold hydrolase [Vicinamibacterales bacterium]|nr:alpha/beta fold hydrolase [Vicinamibacterales bacterium]